MSVPPRILLSGYYGFGNAGDEAILAGLIAAFRRFRPAAELTVLSGNPEATEAEHGVRAAPRSLGSAYRLARRSDLLISGGGGLLQDVTSGRSSLYYLAVIRLARLAGIPVACLGHGIGPLRRPLVRSLTRRVLSRVDVLAVRDTASESALRQLGVTRDIEVTADLAFLLSSPGQEEVDRAWRKAGLSAEVRPAALVALRRPPGDHPGGDLAETLAQAIGRTCEELGLRPLLAPMQHPRDLVFAQHIAQHMGDRAQVVEQPLSACDLLALTAGCEFAIAMRLHALVFAVLCGVPPVAIAYDPKVDALMSRIELTPATSIEAFDGDALLRAAGEVWAARDEIAASLRLRCETLRREALRNLELALRVLPRAS